MSERGHGARRRKREGGKENDDLHGLILIELILILWFGV
jgi:hypothetical protein